MQLRNRRLLLSKKKRHLLLPSQGSPVNLPSKSWLQRFCMQMSDVSKERTGSGGISAIQLSSEHNANNEDVRFELKDLHPDDPQIVVFKHGVGELRGSSK
uniref:Uncharacterized protein n=1 Tax=Brassica campestris TaxID=3711 RepID=M4EVW7_BRACM